MFAEYQVYQEVRAKRVDAKIVNRLSKTVITLDLLYVCNVSNLNTALLK